jgi:hypothetical protein
MRVALGELLSLTSMFYTCFMPKLGMVNTVQQQPPPPKNSILPNLWVVIPIIAVVVAMLSANLLLLNYIHVFTAILWTGTDIFMAFLLGPVLRNVSLATRKEVISWKEGEGYDHE